MDTTIFYILGLGLVVAALVVAAIGLKKEDWPSDGVFKGMVATFSVAVAATMVFSVLNAEAEKEHTEENKEAAAELREVDLTRGEQEADAPEGEPSTAEAAPSQESSAASGPAEELKLTSPESGELAYTPLTLAATAGSVVIDYENPSPVPHNVAVESPDGEVLNESDTGAEGTFEVSIDLEPGEYVYYCTIPGHREGGMEGKLSVE